nr:hypothetical protein [Sulfitobacter sp. R18_1]
MGRVTLGNDLLHCGSTLDINTQLAANFARNKATSSSLLRRAGIRVPDEVVIPSPRWQTSQPALEVLREFADGHEVVVKPNSGTRGIGVTLHGDLLSALRAAWESSDDAVLLQRRVRGPELRVYYLRGRIIGGYWRRQDNDGFGNLSSGEVPELFLGADLPSEIAEITTQSAQVLGLDYSGFDIIVGDLGPVILEANASPRFNAASTHPGGEEWSATLMDTILTEVLKASSR